MRRPDYAAEIARTAADVLALSPQARGLLESEIRGRFGGEVLHIADRPVVTPEVVDARLRAGKPVAVMVRELGVSRSTIYRLIRESGARNRAKTAPK